MSHEYVALLHNQDKCTSRGNLDLQDSFSCDFSF